MLPKTKEASQKPKPGRPGTPLRQWTRCDLHQTLYYAICVACSREEREGMEPGSLGALRGERVDVEIGERPDVEGAR